MLKICSAFLGSEKINTDYIYDIFFFTQTEILLNKMSGIFKNNTLTHSQKNESNVTTMLGAQLVFRENVNLHFLLILQQP